MDFRNTKGITLVSLVIYVVIMLMLIAIIAVFKNNIDKNIDSMGEYTSLVPQINKVHMYMLDEVNIKDNKVLKRNSSGSYIEFSSGNSYMFSDGSLYKNSVEVLSDIIGGSFQVETENNNEVLYVNLSLDDKLQNKQLKYVIKHLDGLDVDNIAPINVTIASSNIEETTFTLTATGADEKSGIVKYEFYINNTLEKTVTITAGTATYDVTGKTANTPYTCKVIVYDNAGNHKESNIITVTTQSLVGKWDGTICTPNVSEGMKKVYWNGNDEIVEGDADYVESEWYDYKEQTSKTPNVGTSKWANVKMSDGSYFVWIPRYEYKILSGEGTSTAGVIDINFISTEKTTPTAGYTIHPAFTSSAPNGGGFGEIPGLWVAKFEASQSNASSSSAGTSSKIKIQPNVQSWRSITIGDVYTNALDYDTRSINNSEFDSHLMKNSEWGAVAYLAWSKYGRNGTEITINNSSSYITGNAGNTIDASSASGTTNAWNTSKGMLASTTGNASGIYDMNGGAYEYVAAYLANGNSYLSSNGSSFASTSVTSNSASTKYVTVYPKGSSDTEANNWNAYKALTNLRGDAMKETASSYSGSASWNGDYSGFPYSIYPFFIRGGYCSFGSNAGAFLFYYYSGVAHSGYGFRVVGL